MEVKPPFSKAIILPEKIQIDPTRDTMVMVANGSSISIPANAFVNKNGEPVKGEVSLEYRQFNSAAQILASGIPMVYEDEKGESHQMESGGMFELRGKANNEEVSIAEGKKIGVNMSSPVKGEFDFYYFEETDVKVASSGIIPAAYAQNTSTANRKGSWKKLTSKVDNTEEEVKEDSGKHYALKFDTVKYPETKHLQSMKWKPWDNNFNVNPKVKENEWVLSEKWEIADIQKPSNAIRVLNKLSNKGSIFDRKAYPLGKSNSFLITDSLASFLYNYSGNKIADLQVTNLPEHFWFFNEVSIDQRKYAEGRVLGYDTNSDLLYYSSAGKLVKNYGKNVYGFFLKNKDRILIVKEAADKKIITVMLADKNGNSFFEGTVENIFPDFSTNFAILGSIILSPDMENFAAVSGNKLLVYNSDGKVSGTTNINDEKDIAFLSYKNAVLITDTKNNKSRIFDWKSNKTYEFDGTERGVDRIVQGWDMPEILLEIDDKVFLYNWETGSKTSFPGKDISVAGKYYLFSYDNRGSETGKVIWNKNGTKIADNYKWHIANSSESKEFFNGLLLYDKGLRWFASDGKLIKDFSHFDTSIVTGTFIPEENKVMVVNKSGLATLWNEKAEMAGSMQLDIKSVPYMIGFEETFIRVLTTEFDQVILDLQGNYLFKHQFYGQICHNPLNKNEFISLTFDQSGSNKQIIKFCEISDFALPADIYRFSLKSGKKTFDTYVKLSGKDLLDIEKYTLQKEVKEGEENKRKAKETNLVRSFQISEFGIYNWDRFYKQDEVIQLVADFDFASDATLYNDVAVFLIAGNQQNVVVKYPKGSWDKFSFDPSVPNTLIAVLPGDKVAVYSGKEFEQLNKDEIKKAKKFTFKMKVLDPVESVQMLDSILKKAS